MSKTRILLAFLSIIILFQGFDAQAQEARKRWEMMNLIRREKLAIILPKAMRENNIDMWIIVNKSGHSDPLSEDVGAGRGSSLWSQGQFLSYTIFTDRGGERIERATLSGRRLNERGALRKLVAERDPKHIGVNMSDKIGQADGLSHTCYLALVKALGEKYAKRLVSAEKLVCEFRSQRVVSEIVAFANAGELTIEIAERALSNEVITPGVTTLADVAWWMKEQLVARGLSVGYNPPAVYMRAPIGKKIEGRQEISSNEHIIQRGEVIKMDWGVNMFNFSCDIKRIAYVLKEGETTLPLWLQNIFDEAVKVRKIIRKHIKPGRTAIETQELIYRKLEEAGFAAISEDNITDTKKTDVTVGMHSVGNQAHCVGPSIWEEKPLRSKLEIKPTNLFAFEFFTYTPVPELGGKKWRIGFEDDVIVTENGVEYLYPVISRILLIR